MTGGLSLETDGHIAVLTIDRPDKLNAFTHEMFAQLAAHSATVQADPDIWTLVVTGAGNRAFCAGGDLAELIPKIAERGPEALFPDPAKRFFGDVFKPVIAAVRGICIAGGLELLLGTDLRIAGDDARFGLGEVRWGIIPGGGSHVRLPRQVPWPIAMQLLLTGEPIDARRAYEVGLVNEVTAPDKALDRALEVAEGICRNGPLAVRTAKEIAVRSLELESGFVLESALNARVLASHDAREGPRAFTERRTPRFTGT